MSSKNDRLEEILHTARNYAQRGNVDLANQLLNDALGYGHKNKLPVDSRIKKIKYYMVRNMVEVCLGYGELYHTEGCDKLAEAWFDEAMVYARKLKQKNIEKRISMIKSKPLS